jgi:uncharacterized membrane protein
MYYIEVFFLSRAYRWVVAQTIAFAICGLGIGLLTLIFGAFNYILPENNITGYFSVSGSLKAMGWCALVTVVGIICMIPHVYFDQMRKKQMFVSGVNWKRDGF